MIYIIIHFIVSSFICYLLYSYWIGRKVLLLLMEKEETLLLFKKKDTLNPKNKSHLNIFENFRKDVWEGSQNNEEDTPHFFFLYLTICTLLLPIAIMLYGWLVNGHEIWPTIKIAFHFYNDWIYLLVGTLIYLLYIHLKNRFLHKIQSILIGYNNIA